MASDMDAIQSEYRLLADDPDEPSAMPSFGRVTTEDLVAHVLILSQRHRRTPDLRETACGIPIHSQFYPPLREQLTLSDGGLCSGCFTAHEIKRAAENDANAADAADAEKRKREAAFDARESKRWKRPTSQGDR